MNYNCEISEESEKIQINFDFTIKLYICRYLFLFIITLYKIYNVIYKMTSSFKNDIKNDYFIFLKNLSLNEVE